MNRRFNPIGELSLVTLKEFNIRVSGSVCGKNLFVMVPRGILDPEKMHTLKRDKDGFKLEQETNVGRPSVIMHNRSKKDKKEDLMLFGPDFHKKAPDVLALTKIQTVKAAMSSDGGITFGTPDYSVKRLPKQTKARQHRELVKKQPSRIGATYFMKLVGSCGVENTAISLGMSTGMVSKILRDKDCKPYYEIAAKHMYCEKFESEVVEPEKSDGDLKHLIAALSEKMSLLEGEILTLASKQDTRWDERIDKIRAIEPYSPIFIDVGEGESADDLISKAKEVLSAEGQQHVTQIFKRGVSFTRVDDDWGQS